MAQFLLLIYGDEKAWGEASQETHEQIMEAHRAFQEKYADVALGWNPLLRSWTGIAVRPDGDGFSVTDGPFVETKEALGGYYVIEAPDIDAAVEIAKHVPVLVGGIEVRRIEPCV